MNDFENDPVAVRRAAKLSALLQATDDPERAVRYPGHRIAGVHLERRVRRWAVAAGIAAVVAVGAGVPPVRAWVVARVASAWTAITGDPAPAAVGSVSPSSVSFVPAGENFRVHARRQAAGDLRIEVTTDSLATAVAHGPSGEWLVLPNAVRLLNDTSATHGYTIRVPRHALMVTVQFGDERPIWCHASSERSYCSFPMRPLGR